MPQYYTGLRGRVDLMDFMDGVDLVDLVDGVMDVRCGMVSRPGRLATPQR